MDAQALSSEDRQWITTLNERLWETISHTMRANMSGHTWQQKERYERGHIEEAQIERLLKLVEANQLFVMMGMGKFSFGLAVSFCEHEPAPTIGPTCVFVLTDNHTWDETPGTKPEATEAFWKRFEPFTHSERNRRILEFYKLDAPRERNHYRY